MLIALMKPISEIKSEVAVLMGGPPTSAQPAETPEAPSSDKGEQTLA